MPTQDQNPFLATPVTHDSMSRENALEQRKSKTALSGNSQGADSNSESRPSDTSHLHTMKAKLSQI